MPFPQRTFHGEVVQVRNAPITVQNVVTYDTVIGVNNADLKLKPGMTANVSIVGAQRDNALKISNAALRFRPPDVTPPPAGALGRRGKPGEHSDRADGVCSCEVPSRARCKSRRGSATGFLPKSSMVCRKETASLPQ